jgi:ORF6N domain
MATEPDIIVIDQIEPMIVTLRGHKVMLDIDLAALYGTTTKRLNQQVKRNRGRFPSTFMFRLTEAEKQELVTNCDRFNNLKHSSSPPSAFTEHGAIMAASILNTPRAVDVSIFVVQAFVKLRQFAMDHQAILKKLSDLEQKLGAHDDAIQQIVLALKHLMMPPIGTKPKRRIGFHVAGNENPQAKKKP